MKVARHVRRLERQRPPDLIERSIEGAAGRQHADHRVRTVVEQNRSIDDGRVRTELVHPERVADDHDPILSQLIFTVDERAPAFGLDAEDVEVVG